MRSRTRTEPLLDCDQRRKIGRYSLAPVLRARASSQRDRRRRVAAADLRLGWKGHPDSVRDLPSPRLQASEISMTKLDRFWQIATRPRGPGFARAQIQRAEIRAGCADMWPADRSFSGYIRKVISKENRKLRPGTAFHSDHTCRRCPGSSAAEFRANCN